MAVLIKDMEMPKDECVGIFVYPDGRVHVWRSMSLVGQEYKAVSIPEPHGRLGDLDAVERNLVKMQMAQKDIVARGIRKSRAVIRDMPTIIPASDELLMTGERMKGE